MKQCYFCANNIDSVDCKKAEVLKRFLSHHGRISPKSETGSLRQASEKIGDRHQKSQNNRASSVRGGLKGFLFSVKFVKFG